MLRVHACRAMTKKDALLFFCPRRTVTCTCTRSSATALAGPTIKSDHAGRTGGTEHAYTHQTRARHEEDTACITAVLFVYATAMRENPFQKMPSTTNARVSLLHTELHSHPIFVLKHTRTAMTSKYPLKRHGIGNGFLPFRLCLSVGVAARTAKPPGVA